MKNAAIQRTRAIAITGLCFLAIALCFAGSSQAKAEASSDGTSTQSTMASNPTYRLGDTVDISGLTINKRTASNGMTVTFSNSSVLTMDDMWAAYPDWSPQIGAIKRDSTPEFLVVTATFRNAGTVESSIPWFEAASGSWRIIPDPSDTMMFNGSTHIEDYRMQPGEEKTVQIVYMLQGTMLSKEQRADMNTLPFDIILPSNHQQSSVRIWGEASV